MASGITRALPNNPYGTQLNPNKFKGSAEHEKPQERSREQTPPLNVTPVEARLPRTRVSTQVEDIEMVTMPSPAVVGQAADTSRMPYSEDANKIKQTRTTPISERYVPGNLIQAALSTPITIPIGELMATSAELRKQMIKELQTQTVRFADINEGGANNSPTTQSTPQVHNLTARPSMKKPEERASLVIIKVNLDLGDKKFWVNAIVDSGSEVNIISRPVAKELNKEYPVLPLEEARCADANGNQGVLTGKFSKVMMFQGAVTTSVALFIGSQKVSFQMLLGRPWIRGNMVSMRERVDGTYLIYEDPYDKGRQTELLVVSEPWNVQAEGPIPVYFMERENIEFEGSWKLQDGESITPSGAPQYQVFMNRVTDPDSSNSLNPRRIEIETRGSGNSDKFKEENTKSSDSMSADTEDMEEESDQYTEESDSSLQRLLDERKEDAQSKVICWRKSCRSPSPIVSPVEQSDKTTEGRTPVTKPIGYTPDEREGRSFLGVLRYLQIHLNPYDHDPSIGLTVPADYPNTNTQIEIYSRVKGRRVYYPRKRLPLWSILGTKVPEEISEVRTCMCSPHDMYDALTSEIRRRVSRIPLTRGREKYIKQADEEEEGTYSLSKANNISNLQQQILMSQPLHSHPSFQGIRQRVHSLTREDEGEVTPPTPPNDEPQPRPLRNSAVYYPLSPSVAIAQLSYLNNSLGHPEVTGPRSFHTIVLTANYSLRLEPDDFRGQQVQHTHTFNATLAEIQGPEGAPTSSRVGHAVILFYPGEHERKPGQIIFGTMY